MRSSFCSAAMSAGARRPAARSQDLLMTEPLPAYTSEHLAALSPAALIDLMAGDEDRVPRSVIEECASRRDEMTAMLEELAARPWPEEEALGDWWLNLHAVMILGLIASERAGRLLVRLMRRMSEAEDINLQDWLAGDWAALFANKPDAVLPVLRELCADRALDWYIRANALDPVLAAAERRGPEALDEALAWVADKAADEAEDWDMRLSSGNILLDFPRLQHRPLLEDLAARQTGFYAHFGRDDIERAFEVQADTPSWKLRDVPWKFYEPERIAARQERWAHEDAESEDATDDALFADTPALPHVRVEPKVGRNDPCPCGSGKKYKKCCLLKAEEGRV
jgi:SEC-C motif/Protein of unknown function (DUF1186)